MQLLSVFFAVISIFCSGACFAEPDAHSFSFKGVRFGDSWSSERRDVGGDNLEPWEMDWSSSPQVFGYPRMWEKEEKDETRLFFGDIALHSIKYKYFDKKLIEISVLFAPTVGCEGIDQVNKMLEIRYGVKFGEKYQRSKGRYENRFANKSVSIDVKCDQPALALYEERDTGERVISIFFRDVKAHRLSQAYVLDVENRRTQKSREAGDQEIKSKINF